MFISLYFPIIYISKFTFHVRFYGKDMMYFKPSNVIHARSIQIDLRIIGKRSHIYYLHIYKSVNGVIKQYFIM